MAQSDKVQSAGPDILVQPRIAPLNVSAYTVVSAAGAGCAATVAALRARRSGLQRNDFGESPLATWIGRVRDVEDHPLPEALSVWEARNNRLAWMGLQTDGFADAARAAGERYGPSRVAVLMGTSTSSIGATEEAYRRLDADGRIPVDLSRPIVHNLHSLGDFVQNALGLTGPAVTLATACSSSAKVFAQAERLLRVGLVDAAVVGGVDTLCGSVLFGFNSLELLSPEPCRPFDEERSGISIGEAAGFALLERDGGKGPWLLGYGETSDAYHMSAPHPDGMGARLAVRDALLRAGLAATDVNYINLHGTGTVRNDQIEADLVASLFPISVAASSTKGWTGHTLGAAGITEAAITLLALENGFVPGTLNCQRMDPCCGPQVCIANLERPIRRALSFSFGFGGSNCVLAFGRERVE